MTSSGVHVTTRITHGECDAVITQTFPLDRTPPTFEMSWLCTFAGEVDLVTDREGMTAGWECPNCTTWHDIEWGD